MSRRQNHEGKNGAAGAGHLILILTIIDDDVGDHPEHTRPIDDVPEKVKSGC